MYLNRYRLRNFRRLEDVEIRLEEEDTIFVGANNSGKTSATAAFRLFVSRRGDFRVHDFFSPLIPKLDRFGDSAFDPGIDYDTELPAIELDLWFTVSAATYGRVAYLLPSVVEEYTEVGVRIRFAAKRPEELHSDYRSAYPPDLGDDPARRTLSYFLSQGDNLKRYFGLQYYTLERATSASSSDETILHPIDQDKGRKAIDSLLQVEYVNAQRNIDDDDSPRSNRLSAVFARYYKQLNLERPSCDLESVRVIDRSNLNLTKHYATQFARLVRVIRSLGFPGLNDRALRVVSNLSPEQALSGNTAVTYVESGSEHELPEAYNGLGFKNLIYIAIQIASFQIQWAEMKEKRPLCQLICIEEPEVHLHPQVQQTFIRQVRSVMNQISEDIGDVGHVQQLVATTHSSHMVAEAELQSIRYFRRKEAEHPTESAILAASEIVSLASFNPQNTEPQNLQFLRKYIALTHCDLFFADAAILVEGTVERLLMPMMIEDAAPDLRSAYLTVLELGGAYAHRFVQLLKFIGLPTLVVTDLDSVDPKANNSACRADHSGAVTSNACIKELIGQKSIEDLLRLSDSKRVVCTDGFSCYVTYQQAVPIPIYGADRVMIPRTFEESFIYENLAAVKGGTIDASVTLSSDVSFEDAYATIYEAVRSQSYKKVEFALAQIETNEQWVTPAYIAEGLRWLGQKLRPTLQAGSEDSRSVSSRAQSQES